MRSIRCISIMRKILTEPIAVCRQQRSPYFSAFTRTQQIVQQSLTRHHACTHHKEVYKAHYTMLNNECEINFFKFVLNENYETRNFFLHSITIRGYLRVRKVYIYK